MHSNEINKDGKHRGFWLIDNKNKKQPFYFTLKKYYAGMKKYVVNFKEKHGRVPNNKEFKKRAVELMK